MGRTEGVVEQLLSILVKQAVSCALSLEQHAIEGRFTKLSYNLPEEI